MVVQGGAGGMSSSGTTLAILNALRPGSSRGSPLGLQIRFGENKTQIWCPLRQTVVPGAENVPRVASLPCVGATMPYTQTAGITELNIQGDRQPLEKVLQELNTLTGHVCELCDAGLPLDDALTLHRTFADGAITHHLRANYVDGTWCARWDQAVQQFWTARVTLRPLTAIRWHS